MLVRAEVDFNARELVALRRIFLGWKFVPRARLWEPTEVGIEVSIIRISKLEELSLIVQQVLLYQRVDPIWLELVDLLVPDNGMTPDRILIVLIWYKNFLGMIDDEVERAQVLSLLIQVGDTSIMN